MQYAFYADNDRPLEEPALRRFDKAHLAELSEYKVTNGVK